MSSSEDKKRKFIFKSPPPRVRSSLLTQDKGAKKLKYGPQFQLVLGQYAYEDSLDRLSSPTSSHNDFEINNENVGQLNINCNGNLNTTITTTTTTAAADAADEANATAASGVTVSEEKTDLIKLNLYKNFKQMLNCKS